jgi:hypothetical protein
MTRTAVAARFALLALLGAATAQAADVPRGKAATSSPHRGTVSAPAATPPRPVPQQPQSYDRPYQSQERRSPAATSAPTSVQFRDKPAYQFTQVAPRSLW